MKTIDEIKIKLLNEEYSDFLISMNDYDINQFDNYGNNILHYYISNLDSIKIPAEKLIPELVRRGLDINARQSKKDFRTALHLAVFMKLKNVVDILVEFDADVDAQDINGNTPLWLAVMNYWNGDDAYFIKLLLKKGAKPGLENKHGVSPISLAETIANTDVCSFFRT